MPDLLVEKSVVGPITLATVRELLWCNCFPVCGLSARWLYGGSHMPHLPGLLQPEPLSPRQVTADPCLSKRHSDTQWQVWLNLSWGSLLLSPGSWCAQGFLVPSKSLFPQSCGSSVIRSHWPSKSNSLGFLSPFAGSPGLKVAVDPRTFTKVQELLWCNCSAVCGSSAQQLCSGADGDPLQKDFCCMPRLPGLLQPEPLSLWQTTADPCLRSRR